MDKKCSTCIYQYPHIECVNCGVSHRNYRTQIAEEMTYADCLATLREYQITVHMSQPQSERIIRALGVAIEAMEIQVPTLIETEIWSPSHCPNCKHELSEFVGDGYYKHPDFLTMCPECGQKIEWRTHQRGYTG